MKDQFLESIEAFGDNIDENLTTPASSHLLIFNKQAQQLDNEKSKKIHSVVAKIIYIMKRARPNLETAISSHAEEYRGEMWTTGKTKETTVTGKGQHL